MALASPEICAGVFRLTVSTLKELLRFKLTVDIQKHLANRQAGDWRAFEFETSVTGEFDGIGILASRDNVSRNIPYGEQGFLIDEVPLASLYISELITAYPLEAASSSYVFTLVEVFGDGVVELVNPNSLDRNKAWHEGIRGFADLRDTAQLQGARKAFGDHFRATAEEVPELAARRMVDLKRCRNAFAHKGAEGIRFTEFVEDALAIVCHICFLVTDEQRISVYPWEDLDGVFTPQS